MLTSTSPLLLFRPMVMRGFLIVNSKSLPSNRAIASPCVSELHAALDGLVGADFSANNARAWLFVGCCIPDIARSSTAKMAAHGEENNIPCTCVYMIQQQLPQCTAALIMPRAISTSTTTNLTTDLFIGL